MIGLIIELVFIPNRKYIHNRFRYNHYEEYGYLFRSINDADQKTT